MRAVLKSPLPSSSYAPRTRFDIYLYCYLEFSFHGKAGYKSIVIIIIKTPNTCRSVESNLWHGIGGARYWGEIPISGRKMTNNCIFLIYRVCLCYYLYRTCLGSLVNIIKHVVGLCTMYMVYYCLYQAITGYTVSSPGKSLVYKCIGTWL